jgi:hypothetical protein
MCHSASFVRVLTLAGAAALAVATAPPAHAGDFTDDVWDVSQGVVVTSSSGAGPGPLENMFGASLPSPPLGRPLPLPRRRRRSHERDARLPPRDDLDPREERVARHVSPRARTRS